MSTQPWRRAEGGGNEGRKRGKGREGEGTRGQATKPEENKDCKQGALLCSSITRTSHTRYYTSLHMPCGEKYGGEGEWALKIRSFHLL